MTSIRTRSIRRVDRDTAADIDDCLAVEEPVEIAIAWKHRGRRIRRNVSVTMRTPATEGQSDADLALGFLFTEGIVQSFDQVDSVDCDSQQQSVTVTMAAGVAVDLCHLKRHFYTTSSCGVCGKTSIDAVSVHLARPLVDHSATISGDLVYGLPDQLRSIQSVFDQTGGLHGCGLFRFDGDCVAHGEDVGRHNAVDKVIGQVLRKYSRPGFPAAQDGFDQSILVLSGRVSFELVQKSLVAGIPVIVAVGAPSSLAVELGGRQGQTIIGFASDRRYNVYCGAQRVSSHSI